MQWLGVHLVPWWGNGRRLPKPHTSGHKQPRDGVGPCDGAEHDRGRRIPPDVADYTELESFEEFLSGRAVFCRIVPTYYALIGGPRSPLSREQVEVTPIPAGTRGQSAGCLGGWNLHINAASDKQEEA